MVDMKVERLVDMTVASLVYLLADQWVGMMAAV
jgi:hypothetical protein